MSHRILWLVCVSVMCLAAACKSDVPKEAGDGDRMEAPKADLSKKQPLTETARDVVDWLVSGDCASLRRTFDRGMADAFPSDDALAKWRHAVVKQTGKFRKHFGVAEKKQGAFTKVTLTAIFDSAPWDVIVLFTAQGQVAGLQVTPTTNHDVRPQTPRPPFPYTTREVSYDNPKGGTRIAGTLSVPAGDGPHPAVLLISGSGSHDRDGTISGHKPFLVIADHLSRKGIAVLRTDDRGVGGSTGDPSQETLETIASDVEASLDFLKHQESIDPERIGLIGHSVGGMIAPMVAARSPDVAFVISLAGPAVRGVKLIPLQVGALLESQGQPEDVVAGIVAAQAKVAPLLAADAPDSELQPAIDELVEAASRSLPKEVPPKVRKKLLKHVAQQVVRPWQRSFAKADPAAHLSRVKVPMLALYCEKDVVVPAGMNFDQAEQALAKAHNEHARVERLPGLNHLFQKAATGSMGEYVLLTQTFDPGALDLITTWLLETIGLAS